jgi:hypothetical protein
MKHQGKTVQSGVTFLMKDDPNKVRYTVVMVHANRSLDYMTESAFLKRRAGESHRTASKTISFGNFINHTFGEWVTSVEEKEMAERKALALIHEMQTEINGVYDEAVIMDALFDAAHGKDISEATLRITDILTANTEASFKAGRDEGYDEGYDAGYNIAIDVTDD